MQTHELISQITEIIPIHQFENSQHKAGWKWGSTGFRLILIVRLFLRVIIIYMKRPCDISWVMIYRHLIILFWPIQSSIYQYTYSGVRFIVKKYTVGWLQKFLEAKLRKLKINWGRMSNIFKIWIRSFYVYVADGNWKAWSIFWTSSSSDYWIHWKHDQTQPKMKIYLKLWLNMAITFWTNSKTLRLHGELYLCPKGINKIYKFNNLNKVFLLINYIRRGISSFLFC